MEQITKTNDYAEYLDEEEDEEGRLLTEDEYVKMLNQRADIFYSDKDKRMKTILPVSMLFGLTVGALFATANMLEIAPGFIDISRKISVQVGQDISREEPEPETPDIEEQINVQREQLASPAEGSSTNSPGGGDPTEVVTSKGILGIMSGAITGQSAASANANALGGHASGIDAVLLGMQGMSSGGATTDTRVGTSGIGFGNGVNSGFDGGSGGIDGLLNRIGIGGGGSNLELEIRDELVLDEPERIESRGIIGGRSRANIMLTVRRNLTSLQHTYTRRLTQTPGLRGTISVKWAIDEFGEVLFCTIESSTINDPELEQQILARVRRWQFGRINKPGDVTEVVYPFVFNEQ